MRLKRLELQGFKSFLDRTILNFDPGITGVVGPNGCGKSNIVDAILWVMGEQSPKHLRGESMTDVIFNGSDTKAATSMAEVSLVLDRTGVALSPAFASFDKGDEIAITRRLYRDSTAEYLINKVPCRLKDIHELFMDTGVGRRAYSIIEQGQIDRMINVKPEDRRGLFEEVAGITKYKVKRREAEKKLEQTQANMLRIQDVTTELEKQIRSLKVQAARAKKYRELKSELEEIDLFLSGRRLFDLVRKAEELKVRFETASNARAEAEARLAESDAKTTEMEIVRLEKERAIQELSVKERDLSLRIQKQESEEQLWEERRQNLQTARTAAETEKTALEEKIQNLNLQCEGLAAELEELEEKVADLQQLITTTEMQLRDRERNRQALQSTRDQWIQSRSHLEQKVASLEKSLEYALAREAEAETQQVQFNQRLTDIVVLLEQQKSSLAQAEEKVVESRAQSEEAELKVSSIVSEVQAISQQLTQSEEALFSAREEFHTLNSRLNSLQELSDNLEGYSDTAKEILSSINQDTVTARPFAALIQPEPGLEDALEVLLGADMSTLIVSTREQAESLVQRIQDQNLERVKVLAQDELTADGPTLLQDSSLKTRPLLNHVRVEPGFEKAVGSILGNVYLCDQTAELFSFRQLHPELTFFSIDTKTVAYSDRAISSGSAPKNAGVFARRREIEELKLKSAEQQNVVRDQEAYRQQLLENLKNQERLQEESKGILSSLHIRGVELRKEREKIQWEVQRTDRDFTAISNESQKNVDLLSRLREQKQKAATDLEGIKTEIQAAIVQIETAETELKDSEQVLIEIRERLSQTKDESSGIRNDVSLCEERKRQASQELNHSEHRVQNLTQQVESSAKEILQLSENMASMAVEREQATVVRNETLVLLSDAQLGFQEVCQSLSELKIQVEKAHKEREEFFAAVRETELEQIEVKSQVERLQSLCDERYQRQAVAIDEAAFIDLEKIPLFAEERDLSWDSMSESQREQRLGEHLEAIRQKVSRYGEVNLTAIQEFEEVQKRYDFLNEQKIDLEKSIKILQEAILKIDDSTKSRFTETFDAVDKKFREIFPILFNGGKAELMLTNPENMLESGVDIMVQPPGKRLQSISLLSGGEKALTAVSLVLSIFARKPSPFCLLDEVDAPLDDANVSRFNTVVRKMAEKTQFIVITHNKKTMEIAEALYGVTMERAGISKMASVRLNVVGNA